MALERGRVRHPADRPRRRDPLLHARPRRLPDRGRPGHRRPAGPPRREGPGGRTGVIAGAGPLSTTARRPPTARAAEPRTAAPTSSGVVIPVAVTARPVSARPAATP